MLYPILSVAEEASHAAEQTAQRWPQLPSEERKAKGTKAPGVLRVIGGPEERSALLSVCPTSRRLDRANQAFSDQGQA